MTEKLPFCECGECGERVTKKGNRFIHGHNCRGKKRSEKEIEKQIKTRKENKDKPKLEPKLCECGCGDYALSGNDYINGHNKNRLGEKMSPEAIIKISIGNKGKVRSKKVLEQMSKTFTGKGNPMYGKKHSQKTCKKIGDANRNPSETTRKKMSKAATGKYEGKNNPMYGVRGGEDLVNHHYIYNESDLSLNTVQMTRSDHQKLHQLLKKLSYKVPHINIKVI